MRPVERGRRINPGRPSISRDHYSGQMVEGRVLQGDGAPSSSC